MYLTKNHQLRVIRMEKVVRLQKNPTRFLSLLLIYLICIIVIMVLTSEVKASDNKDIQPKGWRYQGYELSRSWNYPHPTEKEIPSIQYSLAWSTDAGKILTGDVDGDGAIELVTTTEYMYEIGDIWYSTPTFIDLNDDGDFDLITGQGPGSIIYYENTGNKTKPKWTKNSDMFIGIDVGEYSSPTFVDIDNDIDYDLFIGEKDGTLNFIENIGSASNPQWANIIENYENINIGEYSKPTFIDLDNDIDFDLIIGEYGGTLRWFMNIGNANSPSWLDRGRLRDYQNNVIYVGSHSAPIFTDLDGDEDYDLTIGNAEGKLNYYLNIGEPSIPSWRKSNFTHFDIYSGYLSTPSFSDLDNDGDYDLTIGKSFEGFYYYINIGNSTHSKWTRNQLKVFNGNGSEKWNISLENGGILNILADVTGDSILDIILGTRIDSNPPTLKLLCYDGNGTLQKEISRTGGYIWDGEKIKWENNCNETPLKDCSIVASGVFDFNNDGSKEVIIILQSGYGLEPRGVSIINLDSKKELWYYDTGGARSFAPIADIDNDNKIEIIPTYHTPSNGAEGYGFNGTGTYTDDFNLYTIVINEEGSEKNTLNYTDDGESKGGINHLIVDLDKNGNKEILVLESHDNTYQGTCQIHLLNGTNGDNIETFNGSLNRGWSGIAIGDFNNNGKDEIVIGSNDGYLRLLDYKLDIIRNISQSGTVQAINDINGDGNLEIILMDGVVLRILDNNLEELWNYPIGKGGYAIVSDLIEQGINDIIVAADKIYVFTLSEPDLTLSSENITFSNNFPTEEEMIYINVTVHNNGIINSTNFTVELIVDSKSIANITLSVEMLSSNITSFNWTTISGKHDITIIVDSKNEIKELNEFNNEATKEIFVKTKPDLTLTTDDISFSVEKPIENQTITIYAIIHNKGETNATTEVRFYDGKIIDENLIGVDSLFITGENITITSIEWKAIAGNRLITVIVDFLDEVKESNESNNNASVFIFVMTMPDLFITENDIRFEEKEFIEMQNITINATIHNKGEASATAEVNFYEGENIDEENLIGTDSVFVQGESITIATVEWNALTGYRLITVVVDFLDEVEESNESNNDAFVYIFVKTIPDLFLTKEDIKFLEEELVENQIITIKATIHNNGQANTSNEVNFYEGETIDEKHLIGTDSISVIGENNAIASVKWNALAGNRLITVIVDYLNEINESNESNNEASLYAYVKTRPDLFITEEDIRFHVNNSQFNNFIENQKITIEAKIHNKGEANSTARIRFFYDDLNNIEKQIGSDQLIIIEGEETNNTFVVWDAIFGAHKIYVKIVNSIPEESIIDNNIADKNIFIFSFLCILEPPKMINITLGEEKTVLIKVKSVGRSAKNVNLKIIENPLLNISGVNINIYPKDQNIGTDETVTFHLTINVSEKCSDLINKTQIIIIIAKGNQSIGSSTQIIINIKESTLVEISNEKSFLKDHIITIIYISTLGILVGCLIGYFSTEIGKYNFYLFFFIPLYSKIHKENVMDNETRKKIRRYILQNPGAKWSTIKDAYILANGNLSHHLNILEKKGFIKREKLGMNVFFYPLGYKNTKYNEVLALIEKTEGLSQKEIQTELKLNQSTLSRILKKIVKNKEVEVKKDGRKKLYYKRDQK